MSSCLSPRSNLELRRRQSALVFWDETGSCQRPNSWHHHYLTACLNASFCQRKIKETDAGATSRALPTGNRPPLKAWQGKEKQQKPLLCGFFWKSGYESSWKKRRGSSLFYFTLLFFLLNRPLLALWVIIEKLYSYSLSHPDSIYSSNDNISYSENGLRVLFFWSREDSHSARYKKKPKGKNWSQNLQKTYDYCS